MTGTAPMRRRMLGAALRHHREKLGFTLEEAARILGCHGSKLCRIEVGQRGIRAEDLWILLQEYGADEDERAALAAISDPSAGHGWWDQFCDVLPEAFRDYLSLEAEAARILVYDSHRVPALLQTQAYASAVTAADPVVPADLSERAARAVLVRQQAILARRRSELAVVIGEAALHQLVGSEEVMRGQLSHLATISRGDVNVTVQVLPFTAGAHAGTGTGPVTVLGFARAPGLDVVHLASSPGGVFVDAVEDVACYHGVFLRLQASALAPDASARLFREMADG